MIPLLKTLYGIPAGLLEVQEYKIKAGKKKVEHTEELTTDDLKFNALRRGLLYAHVWAIKSFDMESVRIGMNYLLSEDKLAFLKSWLHEIVEAGKFPEFKPEKVNIDSSLYDFQFLAMGVFLRNYFFPDTTSMHPADRNWLINKLNAADLSGATDTFKGYECILAGYLIALKAANFNKCNMEFVIEKAAKFQVADRTMYFGIIASALFFIGIVESKANLYYFAASSEHLFESIEKYSYDLIHHDLYSPDFDICYDKIADAILHPVPNAIRYYQLKNPRIKNLETVMYSEEISNADTKGKVLVINPVQSMELMNQQKNIYSLMGRFSQNLTVTNDPQLFNLLLQRGLSVVMRNHSGLIEGKLRLSGKEKVLVENASLKRWIKRFFPKAIFADQLEETQVKPHWIIICENYHLSGTDQFLIQKMNLKPKSVTVFNFATPPVLTIPETKKNNQKKKGSLELYPERENEQGSNPQLQSKFEKLFPETHVNVITKTHRESPWEMVLLGIGALQETSFHDCTFIDTRINNSEENAYEIILRCFYDIIVLDKDQRYLFMNLN